MRFMNRTRLTAFAAASFAFVTPLAVSPAQATAVDLPAVFEYPGADVTDVAVTKFSFVNDVAISEGSVVSTPSMMPTQ